tara:strand:+ start:103 stop:372 length:270 start_codon:yes stop_codon:yes gene_type:complete
MATLQQFIDIKSSLSPDQQSSIYEQFINDQDGAINKMISIAKEQGLAITSAEVLSYLKELDNDDEFDDIELTAATLSSISGGYNRGDVC